MVTPNDVLGRILRNTRKDKYSKNYLDPKTLVGKKVTQEQAAQLYNQWKYDIDSTDDEKDLGAPIPNKIDESVFTHKGHFVVLQQGKYPPRVITATKANEMFKEFEDNFWRDWEEKKKR